MFSTGKRRSQVLYVKASVRRWERSDAYVIIPAIDWGSGGFMGLHSFAVRLSLSALLFASLSGAAFGVGPRERTQFGHDISVGAGEEVAEVTCFGCNVHIRGK